MKILLTSPVVSLDNKNIKEMLSPALGLYVLEGITPSEHQVKIVEEEIEDLNLDEECDLVGISCMTANAPRAYELAGEFKKRGKTVVLGGIHPTIMPDEASQYADSIIVGEAEDIWAKLLNDFKYGKLKKRYYSPEPSLDKFIPLDYKKVKSGYLGQLNLITTRGCPYNCEFCSIPKTSSRIRHVPIANIVRCIVESKSKYVVFHDDNIVGDKDYAKELFRELRPLKIKWIGQASIRAADDSELLKLMVDSGCISLFVGIESLSIDQLKLLKKQVDNIQDLESAIKNIKKAGILIHASVIFGFDTDTKDVFKKTLKFLIKSKVCSASFNILTPYPNTSLFDKIKKEGRLITGDWRYYSHSFAVFQPKNMTAYELQSSKINVKKNFYSFFSILKRLPGNWRHPLFFIMANCIWRKEIKMRLDKIPEYIRE